MTLNPPTPTLEAPPLPSTLELGDNTNLYGTPPAALRVLRAAAAGSLTRYPSPFADDLRAVLARHAGVDADQVSTGCGSDDVLDSIFRTFAAPGERIAFPDPTFSMVPVLARRNRLVPFPVPFTKDFDVDADALIASGAPIVYLCSPNNPTGIAASRAAIRRVLDRAPGLVVLDEAYAEFAEDTFLAEAPRRPDFLVVRTLSKAFGLAGLRVGWAVGDASLIARLEQARGPYKVGAVAAEAAVAVVSEDLGWVRERAAEVRRDRVRLIAGLTAMGLSPLPSAANFVLVPVRDAPACAERMLAAGVAVRAFPALAGIGDAVRITVAPAPAMERLLAALRDALP
jgi:histidinol-phosphate aminotransferase